jgi:hypothetical protein
MHDDAVASEAAALLSAPASTRHLLPNIHFTSHLCYFDGPTFPLAILEASQIMRLLQYNNETDFSLTEFFESDIPKYAILSHRWEAEEATFEDLQNGTGTKKAGYEKIRLCGEQAGRDGLKYFWVDTCCIVKSSSAELSEAINSMFHWYRQSTKCYVYLSDVLRTAVNADNLAWESAFRNSNWFT